MNSKKVIIENEIKRISIIEKDNKQYLFKEAFSDDEINNLKNEVFILSIIKDSKYVPKINKYKFSDSNNYFICEYIKGKRFNEIFDYSNEEKIKYMIKLIAAVKDIHYRGIVHCDLKPANILIDENNDIKIVDFGISVLNNKKSVHYGTLSYCSLEQLYGNKVSVQSDIYSLGIILYELLNKKLPFVGTQKEIRKQKKYSKIIKSDNVILNKIYFLSLSNNLNIRYKNIDEFEKDVERLYKFYKK